MKRLFLMFFLLNIGIPCFAENDLYKVEVILFKKLDPASIPSEDIQSHQSLQLPDTLIELAAYDDDSIDIPFRLLEKNQVDMNKEAYALSRRKNYRVMLHIAWLQPMNEKRYSKPVHIYAGPLYNPSEQQTKNNIHELPNSMDNPLGLWEINGTIRVNRSNHFVINSQLTFSLPYDEKQNFAFFNNTAQHPNPVREIKRYYLSQSQNLRLKELHYFDHPLFGMLAKITPAGESITTEAAVTS